MLSRRRCYFRLSVASGPAGGETLAAANVDNVVIIAANYRCCCVVVVVVVCGGGGLRCIRYLCSWQTLYPKSATASDSSAKQRTSLGKQFNEQLKSLMKT
jgi:hypothetical protein